MSANVDPALLHAVDVDPSSVSASITSHGGSGFSSTYKLLITTPGGGKRAYFVKTGTGSDAAARFRGQHHSLNAIRSIIPFLCPGSYGYGTMSWNPGQHFLVVDFLHRVNETQIVYYSPYQSLSFAEKLAKMHTTPAPIPEGYDKPMFGFPVPTCCIQLEQDNSWKEDWAEFFADNRLRHVLKEGERKNGKNNELSDAVEKVASKVVPRLLGQQTIGKVTPVLVHGNLDALNMKTCKFSKKFGFEWVVLNPAAVYGHSEYELATIEMCGDGRAFFWDEYEELVPKHEPKEEWEDRIALYKLYHCLNDWVRYGTGHNRRCAMSDMEKLIAKYA